MKSQIQSWNMQNKNILIRTDFNVPLQNKKIENDFRIRATLPTIDAVLKKGGTPIILTHIGRPKEKDPRLSTQCIAHWFNQNNYKAHFAATIADANRLSAQHPHEIIILENLRFWPEEQQKNKPFAQQLAQLGDYFIQDAFGTMHREDTSITLLPQLFEHNTKSIGLLVEKELTIFDTHIKNAQHPFTVFLGGGKVATKLPIIEQLIGKAQSIALCPAIVFTFLKAMGKNVGTSLIDDDAIEVCKKMITSAHSQKTQLLFPIDYQVAHKSIDGPLSNTQTDDLKDSDYGIAIGPQTIEAWKPAINAAQTIFFNASMGFTDNPHTMQATYALLQTIAHSNAFSIVAGGDSVGAVYASNTTQSINHLSTGGGAALAYISSQSLAGMQALTS